MGTMRRLGVLVVLVGLIALSTVARADRFRSGWYDCRWTNAWAAWKLVAKGTTIVGQENETGRFGGKFEGDRLSLDFPAGKFSKVTRTATGTVTPKGKAILFTVQGSEPGHPPVPKYVVTCLYTGDKKPSPPPPTADTSSPPSHTTDKSSPAASKAGPKTAAQPSGPKCLKNGESSDNGDDSICCNWHGPNEPGSRLFIVGGQFRCQQCLAKGRKYERGDVECCSGRSLNGSSKRCE